MILVFGFLFCPIVFLLQCLTHLKTRRIQLGKTPHLKDGISIPMSRHFNTLTSNNTYLKLKA